MLGISLTFSSKSKKMKKTNYLDISIIDLYQNKMTRRCSDEDHRNINIVFIFLFREKFNDIPNIFHNVSGTSTKQYLYMYNMLPVALIFPSTWKSPRIPPAYAKKTRIPILRTLQVRMPKFAYVKWFAYARRQEYQISVRTQKTCVRKKRIRPQGYHNGCFTGG